MLCQFESDQLSPTAAFTDRNNSAADHENSQMPSPPFECGVDVIEESASGKANLRSCSSNFLVTHADMSDVQFEVFNPSQIRYAESVCSLLTRRSER